MLMIRIFTVLLLAAVWVNPAILSAQNLPEWMIPLRDSIYEQILTADEIVPLYDAAKSAATEEFSGTQLSLTLSRCEYFMGRAYLFEERNNEARAHFSEGLKIAESLINSYPSSEAWLLRGENLSHICQIATVGFVMANGLKIEDYAKQALKFNSRNAPARYLIAARWVYAPAPLNNLKKGIEMMSAILENTDMEKDDFFNVYSAIGYGYMQQKKPSEARIWFNKSLEFYPTNKFVNGLLEKL